jgi:hypothetical protein
LLMLLTELFHIRIGLRVANQVAGGEITL